MGETRITTPGLADSIQAIIKELKQSSDPAVRENAEAMDAQFDDFVVRVMGAMDMARDQRDAAYVEHAELLAMITTIYPGFTRTALLVAAAPLKRRVG